MISQGYVVATFLRHIDVHRDISSYRFELELDQERSIEPPDWKRNSADPKVSVEGSELQVITSPDIPRDSTLLLESFNQRPW
jgi:hypothetical protein